MTNKQIVSLIVIPTLLISNIILGMQYKQYKDTYERNIKSKYKIIKQQEKEIDDHIQLINQKNININNLNMQLDKLKKENEQLKKDLRDRKEAKKQYFVVTFYTNGYESIQKKKGDNGYGITASGTKATEGRTIAAPKSIPFGTKVYIQGIGTRIVEDRGGAVNGNHIDVFVESASKAKQLGKQILLVEILN